MSSSEGPTVVQQTTVIQVGQHKSVGLALLLALVFGPLGMLYATVAGALVMFFIDAVVAFWTLGFGLLLTVPLGAIWAAGAASSHNRALGMATQSVVQTSMQTPAGWHPDPDGGERLRYWDGQHWTGHYSDSGQEVDAAQLTAGPSRTADSDACGSCGTQIAADHKFCPGCGAARPAAV